MAKWRKAIQKYNISGPEKFPERIKLLGPDDNDAFEGETSPCRAEHPIPPYFLSDNGNGALHILNSQRQLVAAFPYNDGTPTRKGLPSAEEALGMALFLMRAIDAEYNL